MEKTKIFITRDIAPVEVDKPYMVTDSYELWWDADAYDWIELFKAILYRQGFDADVIKGIFPDDGE